MSFWVSDPVTLASAVATSGTFVVPYPVGTGQGSFFLSPNHKMSSNQGAFVSPADFTLVFGASEITVAWRNAGTLPTGTVVTLQLDAPGADGFYPVVDAPRVSDAPTKMIDFGTPLATDNDALIVAATAAELPDGTTAEFVDYPFPSAGVGPQDGANQSGVMDFPRNIAIAASHPSAFVATTVIVTGRDVFGAPMVETFGFTGGGTSKTASGEKAFAVVANIRIAGTTGTDDITGNTVNVGFGGELGMPVYMASAGQILAEFEDGAVAAAGTLTAGADGSAPMTGTTGDVRGTYAPASALNADRGFAVLVADINPGYRGPDQFAG